MVAKARLALLLALLVGVVAGVIERAIVSDEERLEAAFLAVLSAAEDESSARLNALLLDTFRYLGPAPVERGDKTRALERFSELWEASEALSVTRRGKSEITIVGALGTLRAPLLVRFTVGGSLILYRADTVMSFDRVGEEFRLGEVEITDLRPGIL